MFVIIVNCIKYRARSMGKVFKTLNKRISYSMTILIPTTMYNRVWIRWPSFSKSVWLKVKYLISVVKDFYGQFLWWRSSCLTQQFYQTTKALKCPRNSWPQKSLRQHYIKFIKLFLFNRTGIQTSRAPPLQAQRMRSHHTTGPSDSEASSEPRCLPQQVLG